MLLLSWDHEFKSNVGIRDYLNKQNLKKWNRSSAFDFSSWIILLRSVLCTTFHNVKTNLDIG